MERRKLQKAIIARGWGYRFVFFGINWCRKTFAALRESSKSLALTPFPAKLYSDPRLFEGRTRVKSAAETSPDEHWMRQALDAAREAQTRGEVPLERVSSVTESSSQFRETELEQTAIRQPTLKSSHCATPPESPANYRLTGVDIYSTIEPCAMCAGALIQARVRRLIYGCKRRESRSRRVALSDLRHGFLNHRIEIVSGVLEDECRAIMQEFFQNRRKYRL
jgi:tRNA(adenine34) deaminase